MIDNIGSRIAEKRKCVGLTQNELADKLFISNKSVSKWENGGSSPSIDLLPALSDILHCSIDYLVRGNYDWHKLFYEEYKVQCIDNYVAKLMENNDYEIQVMSLVIVTGKSGASVKHIINNMSKRGYVYYDQFKQKYYANKEKLHLLKDYLYKFLITKEECDPFCEFEEKYQKIIYEKCYKTKEYDTKVGIVDALKIEDNKLYINGLTIFGKMKFDEKYIPLLLNDAQSIDSSIKEIVLVKD